MKKVKYLQPVLLFLTVCGITYYVFIYSGFGLDSEKRIAGIIASLGLGLGLFQFWLTEINNKRRQDFKLKYEVYKELTRTIQSITEILNTEMASGTDINPHGLVTSLLNLINQFQDVVKINDDFLFPGLQYKDSFKKLTTIAEAILVKADKLRKEIETLENKDNPRNIDLGKMALRMNWHNETRELLKNLHSQKYEFYKEVKKYW